MFVLAGVNGAGKSSIGGHLLEQDGLSWFNPDDYARGLIDAVGGNQVEANAQAWQEGLRRLDLAVANVDSYAFETTLGGNTIPQRIAVASKTHDVMMWFCGLASAELHVARVQARVAAGGHAIDEAKIRERWLTSIQNLITLLPYLTHLQVYDNSAEAKPGKPIPDPQLIAEMQERRLLVPSDITMLQATPDWAKPILEAVMSDDDQRHD
ncbi:MAG: hypothetical protein ABIR16_08915 [Dokdonella sp.]